MMRLLLSLGLLMTVSLSTAQAVEVNTPKADDLLKETAPDSLTVIQRVKAEIGDWKEFCAGGKEKFSSSAAFTGKALASKHIITSTAIPTAAHDSVVYFTAACKETGDMP